MKIAGSCFPDAEAVVPDLAIGGVLRLPAQARFVAAVKDWACSGANNGTELSEWVVDRLDSLCAQHSQTSSPHSNWYTLWSVENIRSTDANISCVMGPAMESCSLHGAVLSPVHVPVALGTFVIAGAGIFEHERADCGKLLLSTQTLTTQDCGGVMMKASNDGYCPFWESFFPIFQTGFSSDLSSECADRRLTRLRLSLSATWGKPSNDADWLPDLTTYSSNKSFLQDSFALNHFNTSTSSDLKNPTQSTTKSNSHDGNLNTHKRPLRPLHNQIHRRLPPQTQHRRIPTKKCLRRHRHRLSRQHARRGLPPRRPRRRPQDRSNLRPAIAAAVASGVECKRWQLQFPICA